jgi:hypothetical protein
MLLAQPVTSAIAPASTAQRAFRTIQVDWTSKCTVVLRHQ